MIDMGHLHRLTGVVPILVTPFLSDETLDLQSMDKLVRFMVDLRVDGVTILGVLGEANRLTDLERQKLVLTSVAAAEGRLPVIVGVSHRGTQASVDLSLMAKAGGASAIMMTPHAEPNLNDERIISMYSRVATACDLPVVVQDHPASSGVYMSTDFLLTLISSIPQVVCIKAEAVPTGPKIRQLKSRLNRPISILTGLGALYAQFDLQAGCDGFMTGFAFPEVLQAMVRAQRDRRYTELKSLYRHFLPLIVYEQQPGVAARKYLLRKRGLLAEATVRHPGTPLPQGEEAQIDGLLDWVLDGQDPTQPLSL